MTRRWPLQALLDATGLSSHHLHQVVKSDPWRYRHRGLSDEMAERWAMRCDLLPHEVWDGWFEAALTVPDRLFVENGWRQAWLWREAQADDELEEAA